MSGTASIMGSAHHSKTTSKSETQLPPPSAEEVQFLNISLGLANQALSNVQRQADLAKYLQEKAPEYLDQLSKSGALDENAFQNQIDQIRANVHTYSDAALRLGEADINRQTQLGLENVRDVLAPERGLRPGDSPILGLGSNIVRDGLFNQGQLVQSIRGQEASTLNSVDEFKAQLAQQAFANRLQLAGGVAGLGLGFNIDAPISNTLANLAGQRIAMGRTKSKVIDQGQSGSGSYSYGGGGGGGGIDLGGGGGGM